MKKLLIVVNSAKFFISHRLPLAVEAQKNGFETEVAFPEDLQTYKDLIKSNNLKIRLISLSRAGKNIFKEFYSFFSLLKTVLISRPDLIHLITIKPVLYVGLISRFLNIPTLIAISGMGYVYKSDGNKFLRRLTDNIYRIILSNKNLRIIVQNTNDEKVIQSIKDLDNKVISLLPGSGVNLREFKFSPPNLNKKTFLMPCRMLWDKGVREFVDAAGKIKDKYPEINFILSGPYEDQNPGKVPIEYLNKLNILGVVRWMGDSKDMPKLYERSTVVVLPSYYNEGLPKVLLEAAASGRPVITSDMPGCKDAVENNKTGLIIPKENSESLYQAMEQLILDEALILKMSQSARIKAEKEFDVRHVIRAHIDIYKELYKP